MQSVTTNFTTQASGASSQISYGVMISFTKGVNSNVSFYTIGTSTIGGADMMLGANGIPAFMDIFQYTDYSDLAISWTTTRNLGQFPYGAFGSQAEIQLDNTSRQFLPNVDPVIGNYITVGRPVKLSVGFQGETINLFSGYGVQPKNSLGDRNFILPAYDAMDYLRNYHSTTTATQVNVYADQIIASLLQEVGFSSSQYILEQSLQQPIGYFSPYGLLVGDIIQALCEAEQGIFFFDENGLAHFWNRQHIANNLTSQWTFDESTLEVAEPQETPIINDVQITANPRAVQAKQQIWQMSSATSIPAPLSAIVFTNLVTNPNFETNLTGWTAVSSVLSQTTAQYYVGITSMQITGNAGFPPSAYATQTYSAGQPYVAQARVKGTAGQIVSLNDGSGSTSPTITLSGNWDLVTWTWNALAGSNKLGISGNTNASTIYVDAFMLQQGTGANVSSTYFDGNSAYNKTNVYVWNGVANASTSSSVPAGFVTISADFQDADGAMPVTSVDQPIYYSSSNVNLTSNYTANFNNDGSGSDAGGVTFIQGQSLSNSASSAASLNGSNYQITFLNTSTVPVYITQFSLYGTPAKITYVINVEYKDTASIALYGTNPANNGQPLVIANDLIQNPSTANSNAYQLVTDFAHPYQRMTIQPFPIPQLQIGDQVTVNLASANNQSLNYTVVGITNGANATDLLSQQLELEVKVLTKYFQINVSAVGGTDQIAP
jgi:hypothetical protein